VPWRSVLEQPALGLGLSPRLGTTLSLPG